jgi:hypothetical protein
VKNRSHGLLRELKEALTVEEYCDAVDQVKNSIQAKIMEREQDI